MNDPFGRSKLPATFDRAGRVALIGRVGQDLLAGHLPDQEARLFVGGALLAWLEHGGSLERDFLAITKAKSHHTAAAIWREMNAHFDEGGQP